MPIAIALMVWKVIVVYVLSRVARAHHDISIQTGVLSSQNDEFCFVIFSAEFSASILEMQLSQILSLIISLTIVLLLL